MESSNFFISVRNISGKQGHRHFGNEPGATHYLEVPDGETPNPDKHSVVQEAWLKEVLNRAKTGTHAVADSQNPVAGYTYGDILIFVHGYNNSMEDVMNRHDLLQKRLRAEGFEGVIVSFDWPSASVTLNYLEDRHDAKTSAYQLVQDGIFLLARNQLIQDKNKCDIDVHLLGHSTGAYVIREAFYEASFNKSLSRINWQVSQIALIGGDISRDALAQDNAKSKPLFKHAMRITNYQNPHDNALKMSNVKRLGTAPRAGRVGLPSNPPENVVNVNVGDYWKSLNQNASHASGNWSHSWHFDDALFAKDLVLTLKGDIDRASIPTRLEKNGQLYLSKKVEFIAGV